MTNLEALAITRGVWQLTTFGLTSHTLSPLLEEEETGT